LVPWGKDISLTRVKKLCLFVVPSCNDPQKSGMQRRNFQRTFGSVPLRNSSNAHVLGMMVMPRMRR
jgi:hypothetical protein